MLDTDRVMSLTRNETTKTRKKAMLMSNNIDFVFKRFFRDSSSMVFFLFKLSIV